MDTLRALELRHSVRSYTDKPISGDTLEKLQKLIADANKKGDVHIQLVLDEPKAFKGFLSKIGGFKNTKNYFALAAKKGKEEALGYYGMMLMAEAQKLGLNTCFVAGTYSKDKNAVDLRRGEKLAAVISVGYGTDNGQPHKSAPLTSFAKLKGDEPDWFMEGLRMAQYAPTAMNRQKFSFDLKKNGKVELEAKGGSAALDAGILKYSFEAGASAKGHNVKWA